MADNALRYLMEHKAYEKPYNPIGNALQSYINYVKPRIANPLQTLAGEAQRFTRMNPQELTGEVANSLNGGIAGTFIGKNAKTWNNVMAETAQQLEDKGVHPEQIWKETGTFKGADGKWRQEIPDNFAYTKGSKPLQQIADIHGNKLGDILRHKEMDVNYPEVKEIPVEFGGNSTGALGFDQFGNPSLRFAESTAGKSSPLHEVQHYIQSKEGFARGGSPEYIRNNPMEFADPDAVEYAKSLPAYARQSTPEAQQQFINDYVGMSLGSPSDVYHRLSGEAEARLTQARMKMTMPERLNSFPPSMFDVPMDKQIVRFGDGEALSVPNAAYRGEHTAPLKDSGAPLHDLTGGGTVYPDDIYSANGLRYYGDGNDLVDRQSYNAIMQAKGNPKAMVTAYRAVPNANSAIEKEIKAINNSLGYKNKHGFFSMKDATHDPFIQKYADSGLGYDDIRMQAIKDMENKVAELQGGLQSTPIINHGDWVTLSKQYAKEHGEGALNGDYKIVSKKIPARRLFTNGDSINEFGFDSTVPALAAGAIGLNALSPYMQEPTY